MTNFLLEIGIENLPASYVLPAVEQLATDAATTLDESRLPHETVRATGTPRRITLRIENLADVQTAAESLVTGPPLARAFAEDGTPTKAATGFARSQGVDVGDLEHIETPKGVYLGVRVRLQRRRAPALLRDISPVLIGGLRFPKTMKWEPSGTRFARPVRWIVALYGSRVIRFQFAGVKSGNRTWGRPWMRGESAVIRSAGGYESVMDRLGIIVDHERRRDRIQAAAERAAAGRGLSLVEDVELLNELTFMVEQPRVLVGGFDASYLELPAEVVTTAMRSHQRYLAMTGKKGRLEPSFVTFTDGPVSAPAVVRRGNERVLKARLEDASFYWREDLKRGVDGLSEALDRIVFIEGLGTLGEKWRRLDNIAREVNARLTQRKPAPDQQVSRVCQLAKADLASEMIKDGKEFTKLQGVIGAHYARACGEVAAVADAIHEHYQPRTPGDPVPRTTLGTVVAVADRIDTICGCFLAGFKPSGSQDPYALRRSANGLIRIIRDEHEMSLETLIDVTLAAYGASQGETTREPVEVRAELVEFLRLRCEAFLKESGVAYDVAAAVAPLVWSTPGLALVRAKSIARMRGHERFERLITGVKRVGNILDADRRHTGVYLADIARAVNDRGDLGGGVVFSPDRFADAKEGALHEALRLAVDDITQLDTAEQFADVLSRLSKLADPIDDYFDSVLVNCDDLAVRENRLNFLSVIYALFARYADFSAIVEQGDEN